MKKLIPAIVMLLVSAVVLSTASYAWFTTSQNVSADGMSVTAQAPASVLIKGVTGSTTTVDPDTGASETVETWSEYAPSFSFPIFTNKLQPASSVDGIEFYAPDECEDFSGAVKYGSAISQKTGSGYWYDYKIKLKNTATESAVVIAVESLTVSNVQVGEQTGTLANALRFALIVDGANAVNAVYYPAGGGAANVTPTLVKLPTGDGVYGDTRATGALDGTCSKVVEVGGTKDYTTFNNTVKGVTTNYAVFGQATADNSSVITLQPLEEKEIIIRVWIEGQDAACVTNNAAMKASLAITFGIKSSN